MKRIVYFALFAFLCLSFKLVLAAEDTRITGETVNGQVTYNPFNLSIRVIGTSPVITLISPRNVSYWTNTSLILNYTVTNYYKTWYNIDNGPNKTTVSAETFNVSSGSHTLYFYANNSDGVTVSKNVTFFADTSQPDIYYPTYKYELGTTRFEYYSTEELQAVPSVVMNKQIYGQISFNSAVNVTGAPTNATHIILEPYMNISYNRIAINSSDMPGFDKPSSLTLRNLSFVNAEILKDDAICPDSICTVISYSSGTLRFNVTGFSVYSAREYVVVNNTVPADGGRGGGGGGGVLPKLKVSKNTISASLKQGETVNDSLTIENDDNYSVTLKIRVDSIQGIITPLEKIITIYPGASSTVSFIITASKTLSPGLYEGSVVFSTGDYDIIQIPAAVAVSSASALLGSNVTILNHDKTVHPGEKLRVQANIYNFGTEDSINATVNYEIRNAKGVVLLASNETFTIESKIFIERGFDIPQTEPDGDYVFYMKAEYGGNIASASDWFKVQKIPFISSTMGLLLIALLILALLIVFVIRRRKQAPYEKEPKIGILKETRHSVNEIAGRLRHLEYVYQHGFVDDNRYTKMKSLLIRQMQQLRKEQ